MTLQYKPKFGSYNLSSAYIDESVLSRPHYKLAEFTDQDSYAYAINVNNGYAYALIGKRFDAKVKTRCPHWPDSRCMTNVALKLDQIICVEKA